MARAAGRGRGGAGHANRAAGPDGAHWLLTARSAHVNPPPRFAKDGMNALGKPELGVKRVCPETGRKFYDLNKDPIVSPYTGVAYPASAFEPVVKVSRVAAEKAAQRPKKDEDDEAVDDADTISLEDADDEATGGTKSSGDEDGDDVDVDVDVDSDDDADAEPFLEDDEDPNDDVTEIIGDREKDEEA
ncbi:TIGR02300 family protein [Methylopila henanensis]|uniref:TIGR02300 family protein n=2 Tax=Methylopila henanensis TaxID=873516 RepID=A0ABW4K4K7_9HYPH